MKKIWIILAGLSVAGSAMADFAIMQGQNNSYYWGTGYATTRIAQEKVNQYCQKETGKACKLTFLIKGSGYVALAESPTRVAYGKSSTQQAADQAALNSCAKETPTSETCTIVASFNDQGVSYNAPTASCVNPATGLPMISGECWGVDVAGNPYGMRNN